MSLASLGIVLNAEIDAGGVFALLKGLCIDVAEGWLSWSHSCFNLEKA